MYLVGLWFEGKNLGAELDETEIENKFVHVVRFILLIVSFYTVIMLFLFILLVIIVLCFITDYNRHMNR